MCKDEESKTTHVMIPRELYHRVRMQCTLEGTTIPAVLVDCLNEWLDGNDEMARVNDVEQDLPFWADKPCEWQRDRDRFVELEQLRRMLRREDPHSLAGRRLAREIAALEQALNVKRQGSVVPLRKKGPPQ